MIWEENIGEREMVEIKHFDHPHLLSLSNKTRNDEIHCEACSKDCVGQTYICSEGCRYGLHESCAKLPQQLQNPFHPEHPLTLQRPGSGDITCFCDVCSHHCFTGFIFCCDKCNFELDLECASMRLVKVKKEGEGQGKLRLPASRHHRHFLLLFEKMPYNRFRCPVCNEFCSDPDPIYCCIPCGFFLHGSCFEKKLPQEIQHFYHPHPLTLCTTQSEPDPDITCKACYKLLNVQDWYYSCKQCDDFLMDIDCTLSPKTIDIATKSQSQIHHFLHGHPLSRRKNKLQGDENVFHDCCVCGKGCLGTTYFCKRGSSPFCNKKSFFHKSCLELPQQICHPFHPYHPLTLTLTLLKQEGNKCNACRKSTHAFTSRTYTHSIAYICESHNNCGFLLHAECSEMMPAMTYEGHTHLLRFREDNMENDKLKCNGCKSNICESYAFTCLYCDLNLHLLCGPLPYIIKHKDYINPLILTNSPVEEEVKDETNEFYCHVCEEERDVLLPVYYCAESQFVAEFKCVHSQILLSLKGEYGDIELRTTLGLQGKLITAYSAKEMWPNKFEQVHQTSTLSDILGSSRKDVVEELSNAYVAMKTITAKDNDCEYWEDMLLSDKAYTQFIKFLDCGREIVEPWKTPEEVAKVGDYVVPIRLAPIIKHLLSKYGDVSAKSIVSPMAKQYLFIVLCECLYSMTNIRVVHITKDLLLNWWTSFKILESTRFEIQFALNHLKRVADAYFGLYVERRLENIDGDIAKLSIELQNLLNKIETLKNKRDLESVKSKSIDECLREASALQYGKASSGLLRIL